MDVVKGVLSVLTYGYICWGSEGNDLETTKNQSLAIKNRPTLPVGSPEKKADYIAEYFAILEQLSERGDWTGDGLVFCIDLFNTISDEHVYQKVRAASLVCARSVESLVRLETRLLALTFLQEVAHGRGKYKYEFLGVRFKAAAALYKLEEHKHDTARALLEIAATKDCPEKIKMMVDGLCGKR